MKLVIYHANCNDGSMAAALMRIHLKDTCSISAKYGDPVPMDAITKAEEVYIVDFSYPKDEMKSIIDFCAMKKMKFLCLDHHKTAEESLKGLPGCKFSKTESGCGMVWSEFFKSTCEDLPGISTGHGYPRAVKWIQDRDLWEFKFEESKTFHAGLSIIPNKNIEKWARLLESTQVDKTMENGRVILKLYQHQIKEAIEEWLDNPTYSKEKDLNKIPIINCTNRSIISELTGQLAKITFGVAISFRKTGRGTEFSIRSRGTNDVSKIAQKFGGGGHRNAAGWIQSD